MTTSLARRPETGGGSPPAVPAGPATARYLLPATERGTARAGGRGARHSDRPAGRPVHVFHPAAEPVSPLATSGAPVRVLAVTTPGRPGPRRASEGETSP